MFESIKTLTVESTSWKCSDAAQLIKDKVIGLLVTPPVPWMLTVYPSTWDCAARLVRGCAAIRLNPAAVPKLPTDLPHGLMIA
jgi:hypothetical protein